MIVSNPEEAAKPQHGVGDIAADLVDHHPFNRTNALIVGAIDGRPFDLVAADQISCFAFFISHVSPPPITNYNEDQPMAVSLVPERGAARRANEKCRSCLPAQATRTIPPIKRLSWHREVNGSCPQSRECGTDMCGKCVELDKKIDITGAL